MSILSFWLRMWEFCHVLLPVTRWHFTTCTTQYVRHHAIHSETLILTQCELGATINHLGGHCADFREQFFFSDPLKVFLMFLGKFTEESFITWFYWGKHNRTEFFFRGPLNEVLFLSTPVLMHGGLICLAFCLSVCLSGVTGPKFKTRK